MKKHGVRAGNGLISNSAVSLPGISWNGTKLLSAIRRCHRRTNSDGHGMSPNCWGFAEDLQVGGVEEEFHRGFPPYVTVRIIAFRLCPAALN